MAQWTIPLVDPLPPFPWAQERGFHTYALDHPRLTCSPPVPSPESFGPRRPKLLWVAWNQHLGDHCSWAVVLERILFLKGFCFLEGILFCSQRHLDPKLPSTCM